MIDFIVNNLFDGFILLALPLAILAGLISFVSPCVLPLVPGYLAYAAGFSQSRGRVLLSLFHTVFSSVAWAQESQSMKKSSREFWESSPLFSVSYSLAYFR